VIILDAYAVLAFLKGEPAAPEVRKLLQTESVALTVVGVAEVLDHLIRIVGVDDDDAVLDLAQLGLLDPPPLDEMTAAAAGMLRARHSHRTRCAVSLADCVAAEVSRRAGSRLATSDPPLLDVCDQEGIAIHPLFASDGTIWSQTR